MKKVPKKTKVKVTPVIVRPRELSHKITSEVVLTTDVI